MKKLTLLCGVLLSILSLPAQTSGGPDAYGYTWKNSNHVTSPPTFNWYDISSIGTQVTGLSDDNVVGPFTIPSGFRFYWYVVNQFWVGSNGYISFAGDNIASPFPGSVPLSTGGNDWIAPMMSDLNFAGAGNPGSVYYHTQGDTLCISYHDVPFWENSTVGYTGACTFQIILNRADTSITFNYKTMNQGGVVTLDNVVGIENNSGSIGIPTMLDQLPADSLTIVYEYPPSTTFAAIDAGMNWNDNARNGAIFLKRTTGVMELKTNVRNYGNQPLGSFTVNNEVRNASSVVQTNGSYNISALGLGKDSTFTFSNTFNPTAAGTYVYNTNITGLSGDVVPGNNTKDMEVIVIDTNASNMVLDYSDGVPDGAGLGWNGGNGGIGIYIEPPMYPVKISSSRFYISANASPPVGFFAKIYDDDGPNGEPGTLLDSVFVAPGQVNTNAFNVVPTSNTNLLIMDGGVYLVWYMGGANINLGRDLTPPISQRTYEILFGGWADYRDIETEDFLLGINVRKIIPKADFAADLSGDPLVLFTDQSTNTPTSWSWDFGDGSPLDTNQNPSHTYDSIGNYEVCLTASNIGGSDKICKTITITNIVPVADFVFNSTNMPTIAFTDLSSNAPVAWHWDFGDGDTASLQNTTHTYKSNGIFNVCLTATNSAGASLPACKDVEIVGVGIAEHSDVSVLQVFPNPVGDQAFIRFEDKRQTDRLEVRCFNVLGEETAITFEQLQEGVSLNTGGLASGAYVVTLYENKQPFATARFVVK
jgi:PKD repeat protein